MRNARGVRGVTASTEHRAHHSRVEVFPIAACSAVGHTATGTSVRDFALCSVFLLRTDRERSLGDESLPSPGARMSVQPVSLVKAALQAPLQPGSSPAPAWLQPGSRAPALT